MRTQSRGKPKKTKKRLSGRFALFITILLFICTVLFLNSRVSSGSLKRVAYWIFNGVRGDATEASVSFDSNNANRFATVRGDLVVLSPDELSVYKLSGKRELSAPVLLRTPAISSCSSRFVAYDLGGLNFAVATNRRLLFSGEAEAKITNVNMNSDGGFTIVTDGPDCKSLVTAYNTACKPIYRFHSSEQYVFDAALSPNGKSLALLTYSASGGRFESALALCHTDADSFYATATLGDSMPMQVIYQSRNSILVICEDKQVLFDSSGNTIATYPYDNFELLAFSVSRGRFSTALLDDYRNGGNSKLAFINCNGETLGNIDYSEDVYSLSSAGSFTAVQFADRCDVYRDNLELAYSFKIPTSVTKCIANGDGTVLALGENFAMLYVP